MLPWRWNAPSGSLPRAFSDMPRSCNGTASSACPDVEAVSDIAVGDATIGDLGDVGTDSLVFAGFGSSLPPSSSSSSESSPISKASGDEGGSDPPPFFGRCISDMLKDAFGELSTPSPRSFLSLFSRSISSWPCSSVKSRRASKRLC